VLKQGRDMAHECESCRRIAEMLSEYLDFELPPQACAEIEQHLAGCAPCIDFAESLKRTVALCRQYQPGTMPQPMSERARGDLEQAWRRMLAARQER
jgi:predicted anti-sigma-YlaC factor YlaD